MRQNGGQNRNPRAKVTLESRHLRYLEPYPRQESNLQSPDPESDALSIRPRGQYLTRRAASGSAYAIVSFSILLTHTKPTCVPPLVPFSAPHLTTNRIPKLRSERPITEACTRDTHTRHASLLTTRPPHKKSPLSVLLYAQRSKRRVQRARQKHQVTCARHADLSLSSTFKSPIQNIRWCV